MKGNEMDLQISPRGTDGTRRIAYSKKVKNRTIKVKFVRYNDTRQKFTNKKRLRWENKMRQQISLSLKVPGHSMK